MSVIADYMPRGNLKLMLADNSISLTLQQKLKIAMDVAKGLSYLNTHRDEDLKIHCNLKSYNILIGRDLEAKVSDYGLRHLKELARTMTSIGSVAWTGKLVLYFLYLFEFYIFVLYLYYLCLLICICSS